MSTTHFQPKQKKNKEQKADGLRVSQHRSKPMLEIWDRLNLPYPLRFQ